MLSFNCILDIKVDSVSKVSGAIADEELLPRIICWATYSGLLARPTFFAFASEDYDEGCVGAFISSTGENNENKLAQLFQIVSTNRNGEG